MSGVKRRWTSQLEQREQVPLHPHCCSLHALSGLADAHPHAGGGSSLSPLIQMFISSGDTLTDTPGNNGSPTTWASLSPVKLTHKISHRTWK